MAAAGLSVGELLPARSLEAAEPARLPGLKSLVELQLVAILGLACHSRKPS